MEYICEENVVHEDLIEKVVNKIPTDEEIYELAEIYKVFADFTRSKILSVLQISELCVCDIAKCLNMTKSAVSHQLRLLRAKRLVKTRKVGKSVFYSLDDEHVNLIFECGLIHVREEK